METGEVVTALRNRDLDAVRELYDTYGDSLFQYCWLMVRRRDAAQAAVGDALAVAREQIDRLGDPVLLRPWLYALARAACRKHRPVPPAEADEPAVRPGQPDADRRDMAWNIVAGMSPDHAEILDLVTRHDMALPEIALALGISEQQAVELTEAAKSELRDCIGAELVVRRGDPGCEGRAAALRGWTGSMTVAFRTRVLDHATGCQACGRHLPGAVSAARVYGYLPVVPSGPRTHAEMLDRLAGKRPPAAAPAAAPANVAAPAEAAAPAGVAAEEQAGQEPPAAHRRVIRTRILVVVVLLAAVAAVGALILGGLRGSGGGRSPGSGAGRTGHASSVTWYVPAERPGGPASGSSPAG